jgi:RNA 2',3'-cyclic 3'-phosphodiesterase
MDHDASAGRLFFAVVPDVDTSLQIRRLAGALKRANKFDAKIIEPDRLHISLFFLGGWPNPVAGTACEAAAEIRAPAFEVLFDRSVSFRGRPGNRPFVLVGEKGLERLRSFRRTLGAAMAGKGLRYQANKDFTPHITLLYAGRNVEEQPIEPISWTVNEFVLIRSLHGHVHIARWPLQ